MKVARFFETVYADDAARSFAERRRRWPDLALYARNTLLRPLDTLLTRHYARHARPVLFIVGAPRSGTTLLYQLLARHLSVAYVSNEMARFWSAPLAGATWIAHRYGEIRPQALFRSQYGRDPDAFGPHEFSWFWHFWGDFRDHDHLRDEELACVDWRAIALRLEALSGFHRAPLVVKSINFTNYQTDVLARSMPHARFLWISRDPLYCAQSILEVRRKRYGDAAKWWSVRPRDVDEWRDRSPADQVVQQIRDIEAALSRAQSKLPSDRLHHIHYEDLVDAPAKTLGTIADFLGVEVRDREELEQTSLKSRNEISLDSESWRALERALEGEAE